MESLSVLEQSLSQLLEQYRQLRKDNEDLRLSLADKQEDLINAHAEIKSLRERVQLLSIARGLSETDESRDYAKQQLSLIIRQIDKALEVLQK